MTCPDVVAYSCAQQRQAASELRKGQTPMLLEMAQDYYVLRVQARNCAMKPESKPACQK
jgi:hypothetical protein